MVLFSVASGVWIEGADRTVGPQLTKEARAIVFTITPEALAVIRRVTDHPTLESTSGVRIARRDNGSSQLEVRAVHRPQPGDGVVERPGARLYLGRDASQRVDGRRLDVLDQRGPVQFILRDAA